MEKGRLVSNRMGSLDTPALLLQPASPVLEMTASVIVWTTVRIFLSKTNLEGQVDC